MLWLNCFCVNALSFLSFFFCGQKMTKKVKPTFTGKVNARQGGQEHWAIIMVDTCYWLKTHLHPSELSPFKASPKAIFFLFGGDVWLIDSSPWSVWERYFLIVFIPDASEIWDRADLCPERKRISLSHLSHRGLKGAPPKGETKSSVWRESIVHKLNEQKKEEKKTSLLWMHHIASLFLRLLWYGGCFASM